MREGASSPCGRRAVHGHRPPRLRRRRQSGWTSVLAWRRPRLGLGAGVVARRQHRGAPLSHGVVTAVGVFVVVQVLLAVIRVAGGDALNGHGSSSSLASCWPGRRRPPRQLSSDASDGPRTRSAIRERSSSSTSVRAAYGPPSSARTPRSSTSTTAPHSPSTPFPGLVEFDAGELAASVLEVAPAALADGGPVDAVGITNQRASTIVWDRATGEPIGPALGWQDLRTVVDCLGAKAEHGLALAPTSPPPRSRGSWTRSTRTVPGTCASARSTRGWRGCSPNGALHVTDRPQRRRHRHGGRRRGPAGMSGPSKRSASRPRCSRPVDSTGLIGHATALPGARRSAGIVGDQQSSLVGQGCVTPGRAKSTFGTGGMLDSDRRQFTHRRSTAAPQPAPSRSSPGRRRRPDVGHRGDHAVGWFERRVAARRPRHHRDGSRQPCIAAACATTDGVIYVPALLGLGTPQWDFGAPARCSASLAARAVRRWCGRCSKGSPTAAPTCSTPRRRTPGSRRRDCGRRRDQRQPDVRAGGRRCDPTSRRRHPGARGDHTRRRVPGRAGGRHVGRHGRHRRQLCPPRRRAGQHAGSGAVGRRGPSRRMDTGLVGSRLLKSRSARAQPGRLGAGTEPRTASRCQERTTPSWTPPLSARTAPPPGGASSRPSGSAACSPRSRSWPAPPAHRAAPPRQRLDPSRPHRPPLSPRRRRPRNARPTRTRRCSASRSRSSSPSATAAYEAVLDRAEALAPGGRLPRHRGLP